MITRRRFTGTIPVVAASLATVEPLLRSAAAWAQPAAPAGHFDPKGKAPSTFTIEALRKARGALPFADQRDFEEQRKGLIAPMPDLKIMADGDHVAWDMERFQFLLEQPEFDPVHPSLHRISVLNMNYGLYEVTPASTRYVASTSPTSRSSAARRDGS